jgi:saccharopine dehydrogenase-like NADP-dependent oxidoreductase
LVAPENDDNPWHYKISWNPRNVVLAGKAGAVYLEHGIEVKKDYASLFKEKHVVNIHDKESFTLAYYPNRNSLGYTELYGLQDAHTFIRTTLRYPEFMSGWNHVISLELTDEEPLYETSNLSLKDFFETHLERKGLKHWLDEYLEKHFLQINHVIESILAQLKELPLAEASDSNRTSLIHKAQQLMANNLHEANLMLQQLLYLGMKDKNTFINKGICSAADVLQFILENKWVLHPADKDMIVMLHEIEYSLNGVPGKIDSSLIVKGEDSLRTAMAKTVGLPLGIAAKNILNGKIKGTGVVVPVDKSIYNPVLKELEKWGVQFKEKKLN